MQFTPQQSALIHSDLDGITVVPAYAGAGKTAALVGLSAQQATSYQKGLYLAYNKSAEMDAGKRFPKAWVTSKTVNGLAFTRVGSKYKHKLRSIKLVEIIKLMGLSWDWNFAKLVQDTLNAWCVSDLYDFPSTAISIDGNLIEKNPARLGYAATVAKSLWERMVDLNDEVPMSHDGYLKLYQLSQPVLPLNYVMLDEGQDTNPVTWDILKRQKIPVILVGDQYQSIYQFRGAFNAMALAQASQTFPLTQSFRFGPDVARIANALLWGFYSETTELEGVGPTTRVGRLEPGMSHAVIARSNATVFTHAVAAMHLGKSLGFVGGVQSYGFEKIIDTWYLANGQNELIRDPFLKSFDTFTDLASYSENAGDMEVKRMVEVVKTYGQEVTRIIPAIHAATLPTIDHVDLILSTAHKCKGLTLRSVVLADDFPDLVGSDRQLLPSELLNRQEVNLLYVAMTRASHHLQLNGSTLDFLECMDIESSQFNRSTESSACTPVTELTEPVAVKVAPLKVPTAWLHNGSEVGRTSFAISVTTPTVDATRCELPEPGLSHAINGLPKQTDLFS